MPNRDLHRRLSETAFLVIDLETTGFVPGSDRIVELAAVKVAPGERPKVLLDTLIDPGIPIPRGATEVHGIEREHVRGAPSFGDVVDLLRNMMANRIVVAHNAPFDLRFLHHELRPRLGDDLKLPNLCTMFLGRQLTRRNFALADACRHFAVKGRPSHSAADDARTTALLLPALIKRLREHREPIDQRLTDRLDLPLLGAPPRLFGGSSSLSKPRRPWPARQTDTEFRRYVQVVLQLVEDLEITDDELERARRHQAKLEPARIRAAHARIYSSVLVRYAEEYQLDRVERRHLRRLHECLSQLGWAPGE